jgi:hypothetical protein
MQRLHLRCEICRYGLHSPSPDFDNGRRALVAEELLDRKGACPEDGPGDLNGKTGAGALTGCCNDDL